MVRSVYNGVERIGSVGLKEQDDVVWVYSLKARNSGGGRAVMKALADACDEHRVTMMLKPKPYQANKGVKPLRKAQLVALYDDFGFKMREDGVMVREPKSFGA